MNRKKLILTAVILTAILAIGGILAYFTDTDTKTNSFTLGKIDVSLSEPSWNAANATNVMPGQSIAKDPTIKNDSTTSPAYVFAKVSVPNATVSIDGNAASSAPLFKFTKNAGWEQVGTEKTEGGKTIYVYAYASGETMTSLAAGASTPAIFSSVTLQNITETSPDGANSVQGSEREIEVKAYGIQTTGLGSNTTPSQIWELVK